jgi:hypothetical protein
MYMVVSIVTITAFNATKTRGSALAHFGQQIQGHGIYQFHDDRGIDINVLVFILTSISAKN